MATKVMNKSARARGLKLVSFEIEEEQWKAFRVHAIQKDQTSSALIRELIAIELKSTKPKRAKRA